MLEFLEKLTLAPDTVSADDLAPVRAAGVSDEAIEDAVHVCSAFSVIVRLADSFDFAIPSDEGFDAGAQRLLARGYKL